MTDPGLRPAKSLQVDVRLWCVVGDYIPLKPLQGVRRKTPPCDSHTPDEIGNFVITAMREYMAMHMPVGTTNLVGLWIWLYGMAGTTSLVKRHKQYIGCYFPTW
jgi:hypothetical protein